MANVTTNRRQSKPGRPRDGFPVYARDNRRRAKKIHGRLYCFDPWADPDGGRQKHLDERDGLHAALSPPP